MFSTGSIVARRLLTAIPLLWGVLTLLFVLLHLMPGDVADFYLRPDLPAEMASQTRENLGLDTPLFTQYLHWLGNTCVFNFQTSLATHRPVITLILETLPRTLLLTGASVLLMYVLGILLGILAAAKKNSFWDYCITNLMLGFYSIPAFLLAMLLILAFPFFPASGAGSWNIGSMSFSAKLVDLLRHLFLPTLTLALANVAIVARHMRTAMSESLSQDYIAAARAKGLPEMRVVCRHALRGALLPLITLGGLTLPFFFSGAVIVEYVFAWHGTGSLIVEAILQRDYPVVLGSTYFLTLLVIAGSLLADLGYALADPRIKKGNTASA